MAGGFGNSHVPLSLPGGATPVVPVQSNFFSRSQVDTCEASKVIMQEIGWLKAVPHHSLLMSETLSNKKHHQDCLSFHTSLQHRLNTWCWWTCPRPSRRRTALSTCDAKSLHPQKKVLQRRGLKIQQTSTNHCRNMSSPTKVWRTSAAIWAATVGAARHFALQLTASGCPSDLGKFQDSCIRSPWSPGHLDSNLVCLSMSPCHGTDCLCVLTTLPWDFRIVYGWRCSIRVAVVVGCAVVVPLTSWVACLRAWPWKKLTVTGQTHTLPSYTLTLLEISKIVGNYPIGPIAVPLSCWVLTPSGYPKMLWALASANANELNVLPIPSASNALVKQEVIGVVEGARPRTPNQLRSSSAETSVLWSFRCSTFEESHCHQWPR